MITSDRSVDSLLSQSTTEIIWYLKINFSNVWFKFALGTALQILFCIPDLYYPLSVA